MTTHYTMLFVQGVIFLTFPFALQSDYLLQHAALYVKFTPDIQKAIAKVIDQNQESEERENLFSTDIPLFEAFPGLKKSLAHISLVDAPTPVSLLKKCSEKFGCELYIKRDDLTGGTKHYGGNKVRKLEFLLADALRHKARSVLTFGCAGSNHVVATLYYAKMLGLRGFALLTPQNNSQVVRKNLLLMTAASPHLNYYPSAAVRELGAEHVLMREAFDNASVPYVIPTGGSCPLGVVGYVNAVYELKKQIEAGLMPEPDYIYVAGGSSGTAAGLLLGVKACNLKSKIVVIAVQSPIKDVISLCIETNRFLHNADSAFPLYSFSEKDIKIAYEFYRPGYGTFSPEGEQATCTMKETEGIIVDGTYTAKACAAMLAHGQEGNLKNKVVLYWHTYCAHELPQDSIAPERHQLPVCLQWYFEHDVQELDKKGTK